MIRVVESVALMYLRHNKSVAQDVRRASDSVLKVNEDRPTYLCKAASNTISEASTDVRWKAMTGHVAIASFDNLVISGWTRKARLERARSK